MRRCGASSEKSGGGNVARNRLKRPCSSCRARGGVPYGIKVAPSDRDAFAAKPHEAPSDSVRLNSIRLSTPWRKVSIGAAAAPARRGACWLRLNIARRPRGRGKPGDWRESGCPHWLDTGRTSRVGAAHYVSAVATSFSGARSSAERSPQSRNRKGEQ